MNLRNRVQLIGNIGSDPKFYEFPDGKKLAKISVATSEFVKYYDGIKKNTQWHDVAVWGNLADVVKNNISKGYEIVVDGVLKNREYVDKNGVKQKTYEIIADTVLFNKPEVKQQTA